MTLAEARAIWQRTANRCLVQEDAKRAPKLACCSSVSPAVRQADDKGHNNAAAGCDIPKTGSLSLNPNPSQFNLCPAPKWWMQPQPNYGYQQILEGDQFNSLVGNTEAFEMHECSQNPARNDLLSEFSTWDFREVEVKDDDDGLELKVEGFPGCEDSKKTNELGLDSGPSWTGAARNNTPWWRTADEDELALLVAWRSLHQVENCDLPCPRNPCAKKAVDVNICCCNYGEISSSFLDPKLQYKPTVGNGCQKHGMPTEGQLTSCIRTPLREDDGAHERIPGESAKATLLEALCHSQTRAREAERAAKVAHSEKEHVIKLALKQASHLFAYKQWLQLLQLENMSLLQLNTKTSHALPIQLPIALPPRSRKMPKSCPQWPSSRRLAKSSCQDIINKYAVVFAVGLGLVGAGFLLGSTIGRMQPTW